MKFNKKKNILVIGKNSFFSKNFCTKLKNHKLKILGRKDKLGAISFKNLDLIINCAADVYVEKKMFNNNTLLVYKILKKYINEKSKAKIIHFGTSAEYGRLNKKANENFLPNPSSVYEGTKSAATMLVQSFSRQFKIPSVIIRPYSIYGPFENSSRILPNIFRHFIIKNELTIYDGYHDYFYIDDLTDIILKLLQKWTIKSYGEILNVGSGKQFSNYDVLKICEKIIKKKSEAKILKKFLKKYDNKYWLTSTKKINSYKFNQKTTLEKGIKKYWNLILTNKKLYWHILNFNNQPHKEWI